MNLGMLIRRARRAKKLSQRELAAQLSMDYSYLCRIESGQRFPSRDFCPALAVFLDMDPEELVRIIWEERKEAQVSRIKKEPRFISYQAIEAFAQKDREEYLKKIGRDFLVLPKDRDKIPWVLCGLRVIYDDVLFGANASEVYAGLFPGDYTYQGAKNAIVIATKNVKKRQKKEISEQTKSFQVLHELAHYQLHWPTQKHNVSMPRLPERPLYCSSGDISPLEFQANSYASAFLMPREEIRQMVAGRTSFSIKEVTGFCDVFFVEPWMVKFRLESLGFSVHQ